MARADRKDARGCTLAEYQRQHNGILAEDPDNADLEACLNMGIESIKRFSGRPTAYPDNEEGLEAFRERVTEYFQYVQSVNSNSDSKHKLLLDVEGLACWLGICRQTLRSYERRPGKFGDFVRLVKQCILSYKVQAGSSFRVPPVLQIFDLCNNFSYSSVNQIRVTTETSDKDEERERQQMLDTQLVKALSEGEGAAGDTLELPQLDF